MFDGWFPDMRPTSERAALEQSLDWYRATIMWQASAVSDADARRCLLPNSAMTIGGIIKHLAWTEDLWMQTKLLGVEAPEPWHSAPLASDPDWPFRSAATDDVRSLLTLYESACARSRRAAAQVDSLEAVAAKASYEKGYGTLRWIIVGLIGETARHAGHVDLMLDVLGPNTPPPTADSSPDPV